MELPGEIRIADIAEQHYWHKYFKAQLVYGIEPGLGNEFYAPEPVSEKHQQKKRKNSCLDCQEKIIYFDTFSKKFLQFPLGDDRMLLYYETIF